MGDQDCLFATDIFGRVLVQWFVRGEDLFSSIFYYESSRLKPQKNSGPTYRIELQKERTKR